MLASPLLYAIMAAGCASNAAMPPGARKSSGIDAERQNQMLAVNSVVRPGDVLTVGVLDLVAPGVVSRRECIVDAEGNIAAPLLGPIRVTGLAVEDVGPHLAKAYDASGACGDGIFIVTRVQADRRNR